MAWTDSTIGTTIKERKVHIDEIISRLNTERIERGFNTVSISITANTTKISYTHINDLRSWITATPPTVGCSSNYGTVNSTNNSTVYATNNSTVRSSYRTAG